MLAAGATVHKAFLRSPAPSNAAAKPLFVFGPAGPRVHPEPIDFGFARLVVEVVLPDVAPAPVAASGAERFDLLWRTVLPKLPFVALGPVQLQWRTEPQHGLLPPGSCSVKPRFVDYPLLVTVALYSSRKPRPLASVE